MKTAIYIENRVTQLVLTPENDWEEAIVKTIHEGAKEIQIYHGGFYQCNGGWNRESTHRNSLMLRVEMKSHDQNGMKLADVIVQP